MHCTQSIAVHGLRGLGAIILLVLAFACGSAYGWLVLPLLIGAVLLLGGCPGCWLTGLFEAIRARRNSDVGPMS
ncbi:hypothetical protein LMTR13_31005 [Bradyrhizobium icense]|uniref:Uncharacterized protein n=1 Tax=Bradyrhizobium icense TaxID=1274631 RepID=A0A1B1UMF7_9BRAD|nr:hypothetical protein LMTR13_31005 [Bradyrhizobium icense]